MVVAYFFVLSKKSPSVIAGRRASLSPCGGFGVQELGLQPYLLSSFV